LKRFLVKSAQSANTRGGAGGGANDWGAGILESEREPLFRAPWPVAALLAVLLAAFAMQSWIGTEAVAGRLGFSPESLAQGRLAPLVVSLFLHGGWAHVLVNSAFILAFGSPVARRCGLDAIGVLAFYGFYLACGVLANLGYAAVHPGGVAVVVGASGAASGLMAAASRLITREPGLAPFRSQAVIGMAVGWLVVNLILALIGAVGMAGLTPGSGGAPVAWEAHVAGYVAGLVLFGPMLRLLRRA
jgi:membrane associated rhomboid family serine protease